MAIRLGAKRNERLARAIEDSAHAIQESVRAIQGLLTATEELFGALDETIDDRDRSEEGFQRMSLRVEALETKVGEITRQLDGLRDLGFQQAIATGAVTSDIDRHHLNNASEYRSLVSGLKQSTAKQLCAAPVEKRARAVADLVLLLLRPRIRDLTVTEALEWLVNRGYDAGAVDVGDFGKRIAAAARVRNAMDHQQLRAELDFGIDVGRLERGEFDIWNHGPLENGRPWFLVAPAYVTPGSRPRVFQKPYVFVAPPKP